MIKFILVMVALYLLIMLGMYLFQRKLMYLPVQANLDPALYGFDSVEKITLTTNDQQNITAWYSKPKENMPTIIYFHGNAENIAVEYRTIRYQAFMQAGFGLLAVSWRGYGDSEGAPTEEGLYKDARAAIVFLQETQKVALKDMLLFGESLGSGAAVQMATEYAAGGIILDSPYTSTTRVASEAYPWLPVSWLLQDKFESWKKIQKIQEMKLLIFHGDADKVIKIHHGRELFELANEPKRAKFLPNVEHVETPPDIVVNEIMDYFISK